MNAKELLNIAKETMQRAYAPYSNFWVAAALLTKSGKVYTGCNIENASFSPTCCAERTAFFKAVSEGEREFAAIAIVGGEKGKITENCPPCGVCRQVMREFCNDDFYVYLMDGAGTVTTLTLQDLLPYSFSSEKLGKE